MVLGGKMSETDFDTSARFVILTIDAYLAN
jgi:hypothetical protein